MLSDGHGDLVQVVERGREDLLGGAQVSRVGEFAGVEPTLQHVDDTLTLLEERIELFGRLGVGERTEFVAQRGDLVRIDLFDARYLELQLAERARRRHRERPGEDRHHRRG